MTMEESQRRMARRVAEGHTMSDFLDEGALAERLSLSRRTLQRFRTTGDGPRFVKLSQRRVGYRVADVEAWAAARTFDSRAAEMAGKSRK